MTGKLITKPNLQGVDDIYQRLIALHQGRDEADSLRVNARLILTLFNHVGDRDILFEAMDLAGAPAQDERANP